MKTQNHSAQAYRFVGFAIENNSLAVLHAAVDEHLEGLLLLQGLLAVAHFALILLLDHGTFAVAVAAVRLHLLNHARAELANDDLHTLTFA